MEPYAEKSMFICTREFVVTHVEDIQNINNDHKKVFIYVHFLS